MKHHLLPIVIFVVFLYFSQFYINRPSHSSTPLGSFIPEQIWGKTLYFQHYLHSKSVKAINWGPINIFIWSTGF